MKDLVIHCDSQLVANQLTREYAGRNQKMKAYMRLAHKLFKSFNLTYIEKFHIISNSHADALATFALVVESDMKRTIEMEFLSKPSIDVEQDCHMVFDIEADMGPYWMDPIICFLRYGNLPDDSNEAY